MTNRDFARLGRAVAARLRQLHSQAPLIVLRPLTHTLRAVVFESSGYDRKSFYVWRLVQPLCVPLDHIALIFGDRLNGPAGQLWTDEGATTMDALTQVVEECALPFLESIESPTDVARLLLSAGDQTPYQLSAAAGLLAKDKNLDACHAVLQTLISTLDPSATAWHGPLLERARWLESTLRTSENDALSQIEQWEQYTIAALRLASLMQKVDGQVN